MSTYSLCSVKPVTITLTNITNSINIPVFGDWPFKSHLTNWPGSKGCVLSLGGYATSAGAGRGTLLHLEALPSEQPNSNTPAGPHPPQESQTLLLQVSRGTRGQPGGAILCRVGFHTQLCGPSPWTPASPNRQCLLFDLFPLLLFLIYSQSSRQYPTEHFWSFLFFSFFKINSLFIEV